MRFLLGIPVAVGVLILTMALGTWAISRNDETYRRQLLIETRVQDLIQLRSDLSNMLVRALLEENSLRISRFEAVSYEFTAAMSELTALTRDSRLAGEVDAIVVKNTPFQQHEHRVLADIRAGNWDDGRRVLFGEDYKQSLKIYEINAETAVLAMKAQHAAERQQVEYVRWLMQVLNLGALALLLWVGSSFSRRLRTEIERLGRSERALQASEDELRRLTSHEQLLREASLKRLAQEIHDELGQRLTVLRMDVAMLPSAVKADPAARLPAKVAELKGGIDGILTIVRDIAGKLRPATLEVGLGAAAEALAQEFRESLQIPVWFSNAMPADLALDDEQTTAVFRILQESLTNAARHAHARQIHVSLSADDRHLRLVVQDDGLGFDAAPGPSFGLSGMRERAASLGGRLAVKSAGGAGTTVAAEIPLAPATPPGSIRPGRAPDGDGETAPEAGAPSDRAAR